MPARFRLVPRLSPYTPVELATRALLLALALAAPRGHAEPADVEMAETLAHARYYEGIPGNSARSLGEAGIARLAELLADPGERAHHAQILEALGMSQRSGAFEAIAAFADQPLAGPVDSAHFNAQLALPLALGHLARSDDRALRRLLAIAGAPAAPATWSYRYMDGGRIGAELRRAAISGLGLCGRPEALDALERMSREAGASGPSGINAHLRDARAIHARMQQRRAER